MLGLWTAEWRRLLRRVARVTGDVAAAEDALQSAYIRVQDYAQRRPVKDEGALLARTAANLALDERRRAARWATSSIEAVSQHLIDPSPLPDEAFLAAERLRLVEAELARMPQRTRAIFLMHRLDGLKYREIALRVGVSVSAVEKHIAAAALRLAEAVRAVDDEP